MGKRPRERLLHALKELIQRGDSKELEELFSEAGGGDEEVVGLFCKRLLGDEKRCEATWESLSDAGRRTVSGAARRVLLERSMVPLEDDLADADVYLGICPLLLGYAYVPINLNYFDVNKVEYNGVKTALEGVRGTLSMLERRLPEEVRSLTRCLGEIERDLLGDCPRSPPNISPCGSCRERDPNCNKKKVRLNPCFFASPYFRVQPPTLGLKRDKRRKDRLLLVYRDFVVAVVDGGAE